ncbi:MAG TPA: WSC domain-containing protein [Syntrophales bacterium]|nr:WSC domain-containing protein [Syntrophales bacterium]
MTKSRFLAFVAAMAMGLLWIPAQAMETREFEAVSRDQGDVSVTMGKFDFCALTAVLSGGFNSMCVVRKQGENWVLIAVDPPKPDPWVGESQLCRAACFSLSKAPPVAPPTAGVRYIGCFKDTSTRDLSGYTTGNASGMTTQMCVNVCREKGFAYAATQYGQQCFCGNSYGKYGPANNCNMKCAGNAAETCGGTWANSVYSIK